MSQIDENDSKIESSDTKVLTISLTWTEYKKTIPISLFLTIFVYFCNRANFLSISIWIIGLSSLLLAIALSTKVFLQCGKETENKKLSFDHKKIGVPGIFFILFFTLFSLFYGIHYYNRSEDVLSEFMISGSSILTLALVMIIIIAIMSTLLSLLVRVVF